MNIGVKRLKGRRTNASSAGFKSLRFETLEDRQLLAMTYFVDGVGGDGPGGSDANDGMSLGSAFATIQHAASLAQPGDIVEIRGGIYREEVNLPRSGDSANPITFRAYNNEDAVISGGDLVTGWTQHSGNIWVATANWNANNTRDANTLFVNGVLSEEGRHHADTDFFNIDDWGAVPNGSLPDNTQTLDTNDLGGFPDDFWNGAKIKFHINDFGFETRTIADFNGSNGVITFDSPVGLTIQKQTNGYYIFDSLNTLDKPGEWYKDTGNNLYYHAEPGQDPNTLDIEFKRRAFGFRASGRDHIHIEGIEFRGVSIDTDANTDHNVYRGNRFHGYDKDNFGRFWMRGDHNVLRDNEISNTWTSFITVGGLRNEIVNNYIHHIGYLATTRTITASGAEELLVSHNTVETFARSFMDGYPIRSEIAYNEFIDGGNLSWDTGVFDADGANGNSSNSIFHHNVLRDTTTRGIYIGVYGRNANAVFHHNLIHDYEGTGRTVFASFEFDFRQAHHNTFITSFAGKPFGDQSGSDLVEIGYNNNIQISLQDVEAIGTDTRGSYNYSPSDFVDFANDNYQLAAGSGAIDTGIVLPGINDGFVGAAPDAGAFEFGQVAWEAGHDFASPPTPVYAWQALPGTNLYNNGLFSAGIDDWTIVSGSPNSADRNSGNLQTTGATLTGTFRTQSVEFVPGDEIRRTFDGLTPNTTYTLGVGARSANRLLDANQFDGQLGSISTGTHRAEDYVTGLGSGEWIRYDNVDFGEPGQFDLFDVLSIRNPNNFALPIDGVGIEVRLDSPTGPLLADIDRVISGAQVDRWRAQSVPFLQSVAGAHNIYVSTTGSNGANLAIGSFRLLKENTPAQDRLTATITSSGAPGVKAFVGDAFWERVNDEISFTTGPTATTAQVSLVNNGRTNTYLDRLYLVEGYPTRGSADPVDISTGIAAAEASVDATTSTSVPALVDGSFAGNIVTGNTPESWLQVDLGERQPIHGIVLNAPSSNPERASNFRVSVWSDDPRSGGVELWNQDYFTDGQSLAAGESLFIYGKEFGRDGETRLEAVDGQFVRVQLLGTNNAGDYRLALRELQVLGFNRANLAVTDGLATQSSTFGGLIAGNANDGDSSTRSATDPAATNSWWQVRFPRGFSIGQIELVNHDGPEFAELSDFTVSIWDEDPAVGGTKVWEQSYFGTGSVGQGETFVIGGSEIGANGFTRLATAHTGQVVRVQLNGMNNAGNGRLSLAEVRVLASNNAPAATNLAQSGTASQRNEFYGDTAAFGTGFGFADVATDGIILPVVNFSSALNEPNGWWQVDLERNSQIDQIVLFNRIDVPFRLDDFFVQVWSDDPDNGGSLLWDNFYEYSGSAPAYSTGNTIGAGGALIIEGSDTDSGLRLDEVSGGRYVRVQMTDSDLLSLAEVQVWTTPAGAVDPVSVNLSALSYDYDFGTPLSPVQSGTSRITADSTGDVFWSGNVGDRDAGGSSGADTQDVVFGATQGTLHHSLATGVWEVSLTIGDAEKDVDNIRVFAEGRLLNDTNAADVDSSAGQFQTVVGVVAVSDGQLDLTFEDLGGLDREWVVNRLSITQIGDENYILFDPQQTTYDYDLGTATSALETGFSRISDLTHGDVTWSGAVQSSDRASGGDLDRDFVFGTSPTTLEHPIPAGIWDVTVRVGDTSVARDNISISAEGVVQVADIDTAAGQLAEHTFRLEVSDGGLTLELQDNGGTDDQWVLNSLSFTKVNDIPLAPGDFDANQIVDHVDLSLWSSAYATSTTSDADLDRDSDGTDFLLWQRNLGIGVQTTTVLLDAGNGNGSFEDQTGATGDTVVPSLDRVFSNSGVATLPGWSVQTTGIAGWDGLFDDAASDGSVYAFAIGNGQGVYTSDPVASHTTAANDEFTLSFDVGDTGGTHTYEARLRFGGTTRVLGSISNSTDISGGALTQQSFSYSVVAADVGFAPVIEIVMTNGSAVSQSFFDNVELSVTTTLLPIQAIAELQQTDSLPAITAAGASNPSQATAATIVEQPSISVSAVDADRRATRVGLTSSVSTGDPADTVDGLSTGVNVNGLVGILLSDRVAHELHAEESFKEQYFHEFSDASGQLPLPANLPVSVEEAIVDSLADASLEVEGTSTAEQDVRPVDSAFELL